MLKKNLGLGHKESIYQKALAKEFKNVDLAFEQEKKMPVFYEGEKIGTYQPDFLVDDKIIVELKALPFIGKNELKQLWTYLKGSPYKLALLINFSPAGIEFKRIINDKTQGGPRSSASSQRKSALESPHFLSMSATPIPRTLTMTVFGNLDLSLITELPAGRKPIETKIVTPIERQATYEFIRGEIKKGRQAFVICPLITQTNADQEQTDADEYISRLRLSAKSQRSSACEDVTSVEAEYEKLGKKVFPELTLAMLHGQMKPKEKESIMRDFKDKKINMLIATSIIEVGVDVQNASIMIIEGADRFGLAQLYQFRGRIGRGEHQSYCFLMTETKGEKAKARLQAILRAKNGFELAEEDLKLRGPGEFMGVVQSGFSDATLEALRDPELVKTSREAAAHILQHDAKLTRAPLLKARLAAFEKTLHRE
jgi:ATP-dependent DNA helicase RecG